MDGEQRRRELMKKERAIKISFRKRKKNLLKKGYELATLCGIDLCIIIIYDPIQGNAKHVKPETWPEDAHKVKHIITKYKCSDQAKKQYHIPGNFVSRQKKIVADIANLRKQICTTKYPPWVDRIDNSSEDELKLLLARLDIKLDEVHERINKLKETDIVSSTDATQIADPIELFQKTEKLGDNNESNLEYQNTSHGYPRRQQTILDMKQLDTQVLNHFQEGHLGYYPQMREFNPHVRGAAAATSNDTQFPQMNRPMCFNPAPWKWENVMFNNPNPWLNNFTLPMQPTLSPLQYPTMFGIPPQMHTSQTNEFVDFLQMKNKVERR